MVREQLSYKNNRLYPTIYRYSYANDKTDQIYPTTGNPAISSSCYFDLSTFDAVYKEAGKPNLTYSSDNEQFNLAVIIKDQNKAPLLVNYLFEYKDDVRFLDSTSFDSNNGRFTDIFYNSTTNSLDLTNANFILKSNNPTISANFTNLSSTSLIL